MLFTNNYILRYKTPRSLSTWVLNLHKSKRLTEYEKKSLASPRALPSYPVLPH